MTLKQIDRRAQLAPEEFAREYLQGVGRPVIVTDATDEWAARSKWTFEHFRSTYGSETVFPSAGIGAKAIKMTKLADFIDHLDAPAEKLRGFWIDPALRRPVSQPVEPPSSPLYLFSWDAFRNHPELLGDIEPSEYFVDDWSRALSPTIRDIFQSTSEREYRNLFIGPQDTVSKLHCDFGHTHSCLAQISGKKRCLAFSPEDSRFLYNGDVDPEQPDLDRFPLFDSVTAFEGVIEPGDILFLPARWWHVVRALDKSITVSHNFFNATNCNEYLSHLLKRLPALAHLVSTRSDWRDALGIKWSSKEFDYRMSSEP